MEFHLKRFVVLPLATVPLLHGPLKIPAGNGWIPGAGFQLATIATVAAPGFAQGKPPTKNDSQQRNNNNKSK